MGATGAGGEAVLVKGRKVAFRHPGFWPHESAFRHDSITERSSELSVIIESLDLQPPVRVAGTHEFLGRDLDQNFRFRYRTGC